MSAPLQSSQPSRAAFLQPVTAGVVAAIVGFASSFAVVLQGLAGVGASPAEAASGLLVLCIGQGALAIFLGLRRRQPISIAWSTPGAALLMAAGTPAGGFGVAVTAFLISGLLLVIAGIWRPLGRAVTAIPLPLASAMLAGVLMELCLAPVKAVARFPDLALPIVLAWAIGWCCARRYAVLIAVAATIIIVMITTPLPSQALALFRPEFTLTTPVFNLSAAVSLAVPLFVVNMASQNLPGIAVLKTNGFSVPVDKMFVTTGLASLPVALFGGHGLNLSAITAALCAGPEAGPDPERRYLASVTAGVIYIIIGPLAGIAAVFIAASPPLLIQTVAGLALLSSLVAAMSATVTKESHQLAAIVTFITGASGISLFGIGAPLWGLLAGLFLLLLERGMTKARGAKKTAA